jgi:hypothetical protein
MNYGVIVANEVENHLLDGAALAATTAAVPGEGTTSG